MTKPTFANLKLKTDLSIKEVKFNDEISIEVKQYLPVLDKKDLIDITLQKSKEGGFYNPLLIDVYFHLHIVYLYTNIAFTDKQREDEFKIYDALESNGLLGEILKAIPDNEYDNLFDLLQERINVESEYQTSIGAVVASLVNDLPEKMEDVAKIMDNLKPENFAEAKKFVEFARESNNGQALS